MPSYRPGGRSRESTAGREERFTPVGPSGGTETVQLRKALTDRGNGIAPVVGIALLLGITVLLVVTVGAFITGTVIDASPAESPDAKFSFRYFNQSAADSSTTSLEGDVVYIRHGGGDTMSGSNLDLAVVNAKTGVGSAPPSGPTSPFSGQVEPGTEVTLSDASWGLSGPKDPPNDVSYYAATVRVVWTSPDGQTSAVLASWSGPEA